MGKYGQHLDLNHPDASYPISKEAMRKSSKHQGHSLFRPWGILALRIQIFAKSTAFLLMAFASVAFSEDSPLPTDPTLWLKADAGVIEENGQVARWEDQSSNGNHAAQGIDIYRPRLESSGLNGKPSLCFEGKQILVTDHFSLNGTEVSVFFVGQVESKVSAYQMLLVYGEANMDHGVVRGGFYVYNTTVFPGGGNAVNIYTQKGASISAPNWLGGSSPKIGEFSFKVDGPSSVSVDGALVDSTQEQSTLLPFNPLQIGAASFEAGPHLGLFGLISEILIYNRDLSNEDRAQVLSYLANKYGISASLNE